MRRRQVTVRIDDRVVCGRCVVADHALARMWGLLGRADLARGEGVLLRPARSIHTFFMRFPIDAVFLSHEDIVVEVVPRLRPWRAASAKGARSVLELAAGEAESRGIEVGSMLQFDAEPSRTHVALREAAQTMSEYVVVLVVITVTIMTAIALLAGAVASLLNLTSSLIS